MIQLKHKKYITAAVITGFLAPVVITPIAYFCFPITYIDEMPQYAPESNLLLEFSLAMLIGACTVMGIKLADEKKVLPAAGFTMLAISNGVIMAALFETMLGGGAKEWMKSYYIVTSSNFLYFPSMLLISANDEFMKWVRYLGVFSSVPFLLVSIIFISGYRNFNVMEQINSYAYLLTLLTQTMWAVSAYKRRNMN